MDILIKIMEIYKWNSVEKDKIEQNKNNNKLISYNII